MIYNGDFRDLLTSLKESKIVVPLIFADPPDNLGLKYGEYHDKLRADAYYSMLYDMLSNSLCVCTTFWLSYYWQHDLEIKYMVRNLLKFERPTWKAKTFIWRYTFGQHNQHDFGSGFRYLLRLTSMNSVFRPDSVRIKSARQRMGDPRASEKGRVPDDVWAYGPAIFDFSRIVGNSKERRPWHPTQHPEALISRIIRMHSIPGHSVIDLFGGSGTTLRVAKKLHRTCVVSEIDSDYAKQIAKETGCELVTKLTERQIDELHNGRH